MIFGIIIIEIKILTHRLYLINACRRIRIMKIVIDTETTGVTTSDEILQVSIIDEHANVLFNELIRPDFKESWSFAQAVHGISPENVANCNNFAYFRDKIQNIIKFLFFIRSCDELCHIFS